MPRGGVHVFSATRGTRVRNQGGGAASAPHHVGRGYGRGSKHFREKEKNKSFAVRVVGTFDVETFARRRPRVVRWWQQPGVSTGTRTGAEGRSSGGMVVTKEQGKKETLICFRFFLTVCVVCLCHL